MDSLISKNPLLILRELEQTFGPDQIAENTPMQRTTPSTMGLAFTLGNEKNCLVESCFIQEVLRSDVLSNLSQVPATKAWLKGLISLRGQALPIVDLGDYLFNEPTEVDHNCRILVTKLNGFVNGVLASRVMGLKRITSNGNQMTEHAVFAELSCDNQSWQYINIPLLGKSQEFRNPAVTS